MSQKIIFAAAVHVMLVLTFQVPVFADASQMKAAMVNTDSIPQAGMGSLLQEAISDDFQERKEALIDRVDNLAQAIQEKEAERNKKLQEIIEDTVPEAAAFGEKFDFTRKQFETVYAQFKRLSAISGMTEELKSQIPALMTEMMQYRSKLNGQRQRYLENLMKKMDQSKKEMTLLREKRETLEGFRNQVVMGRETLSEMESAFQQQFSDAKNFTLIQNPSGPEKEIQDPTFRLKSNLEKLQAVNRKLQAAASVLPQPSRG